MFIKSFNLFLALISITIFNLNSSLANDSQAEQEPVVVIEENPDSYPEAGQIIIITDESFEENEPPVYTEEELQSSREELGIYEAISDEKFTMYEFRTDGTFVISTENFTNLKSAQSFCSNNTNFENLGDNNYNLIDPGEALGFAFMGMPFSTLLDTAVMYKPVIDFEGFRTGVIFWTTSKFNQVGDNTVFGFTDGNGAGAGALQDVEELNKRLLESDGAPVAMPVICIDDKLKSFFEGPEEEEVIIIDAQ